MKEMAANGSLGGDIDESLYSRQLYVLGHDAMRRMASSDVLISGLGGVGVEIAKNVILGGVKSVTLHDTKKTSTGDLASQFFLTEADLRTNRATASHQRLAELNTYVPISTSTQPLSEDFVTRFRCVVLTDSPLEEQLRISKVCHVRNIAFIVASVRGLFGQIFCDFGDSFEVVDPDGENPQSAMIASITKEVRNVV